MSIRYVSRDNVDLRGESLENPRNVVILWETPVGSATVTPSDNDYTVTGLIVYTDNSDDYRIWRRNSTVFADAADNALSPDSVQGGAYWDEIEVGGGRDFQISQTAPTTNSEGGTLADGDEWLDSTSGSQYIWIVADTPANSKWVQTSGAGDQSGSVSPGSGITTAQADARYFQQTNNLSEVQDAAEARNNLGVVNGIPLWVANTTYNIGETFYTNADTNLFPEALHNTIFRVAATYPAGTTLTQGVVDAGTIVAIGAAGSTGGGGIDLWTASTDYVVGDVFFTNLDSSLFPSGAQDTIYRVNTAHTSGTTLTQALIDNSTVIAIGGVNTANVYFYTPGAYYSVGDIIATNSASRLQFYELSGTDITNAPATFTAAQALSGVTLTLRDTELENNRNAISHARNFFFPEGLDGANVLDQGQLIIAGNKLWRARSENTLANLGPAGYDNLDNWTPVSDVEIRNDDPAITDQVPGRIWYNTLTDELRYNNGNRDVIVINNQNIQDIVDTDISQQRM